MSTTPTVKATAHRRPIAIVGGGLTGLVCAGALRDAGHTVTVFDKGRAAGGRLATRRVATAQFDLGAQYFTVEDAAFTRAVDGWRQAGVCAPWTGRIAATAGPGATFEMPEPRERLVGTPGMSALARHLGEGLDVRTSHRVETITHAHGRFRIHGTRAHGEILGAAPPSVAQESFGAFEAVILCLPASQSTELLAPLSPTLAAVPQGVVLDPCFALGFAGAEADEERLRAIPYDGVFVGRDADPAPASPLSWVARDASKPDRPHGEQWVLHARGGWSRSVYDRSAEVVTEALLAAFAALFDLTPLHPPTTTLQRWAFAKAAKPLECGASFDPTLALGVGGDWASGGRIEGSFLSGRALAAGMLERL